MGSPSVAPCSISQHYSAAPVRFSSRSALVTVCALAQANVAGNYLGVEVYRPGIGHLLLELQRRHLSNVRIIAGDARAVVAARIPHASLAAVYILFPDPWPKKRHHKRRLLQADLVAQLQHRLERGGRLYLATDWQGYAEHVLAVIAQVPGLRRVVLAGRDAAPHGDRPPTRFERRGRQLGHRIWELAFERTA
jgi:tRNA (guanine-N7-)-methyltransferase